jgi:hypothetical protein
MPADSEEFQRFLRSAANRADESGVSLSDWLMQNAEASNAPSVSQSAGGIGNSQSVHYHKHEWFSRNSFFAVFNPVVRLAVKLVVPSSWGSFAKGSLATTLVFLVTVFVRVLMQR